MTETTKRLGAALQFRFRESLIRRMDWRMIDALSKLDDVEDARNASPPFPSDKAVIGGKEPAK